MNVRIGRNPDPAVRERAGRGASWASLARMAMRAWSGRWARVALACGGLLLAHGAPAAPPPVSVGVVLDVKGRCTITGVDGRSSPAVGGRELFPRDKVQCTDGTLKLRLGCVEQTLTAAPDPIAVAWGRSKTACNEPLLADIFRDYGEPGGRERGTGGIVWSPADLHAAVPSLLVLRWDPQPGRKLRFELRQRRTNAAGGREDAVLWKSGEVDGALGRLDRPDLRAVLAKLQSAPAGEPLLLWVLGTAPLDQMTRFRLLDAGEEKELRGDLDAVETLSADAFVRRIGRAAIFKRYGLYPEAALEYEDALKLAPGSGKLRERAMEAYALAGNAARAKQLAAAPDAG